MRMRLGLKGCCTAGAVAASLLVCCMLQPLHMCSTSQNVCSYVAATAWLQHITVHCRRSQQQHELCRRSLPH